MANILIVEDEASTLNVLSTLLKTEGYDVTGVGNGNEAVNLLQHESFDLMLSDIHMTPVDGMELLKIAHERQPSMAIIMLTAYGRVETAVESLKLGAFDYVTKPFKVDELFLTVQKALEFSAARGAAVGVPAEVHYGFENIVAAGAAMRSVCAMLERVAQTEVMVFIQGEDGVGKTLVARTIHSASKRRDAPFVHINCAEMTEPILGYALFGSPPEDARPGEPGAFEKAGKGTLYIDGIQAMPPAIQDRLLEVLRDKTVKPGGGGKAIPLDARLLASSTVPLDTLGKSGKLRRELYIRLSALPVEIKPLRNRPEDILPLVFHALRESIGPDKPLPEITPEACAILRQYRWPGNVRELKNVIQRALGSIGDTLGREALPPAMIVDSQKQGKPAGGKTSAAEAYRARGLKAFLMREKERTTIVRALETNGDDKGKAAASLKINVAELQRKIREHNLRE